MLKRVQHAEGEMVALPATHSPTHCSCGKRNPDPFAPLLHRSKACTHEGFTMFSLISLFLAARREVTLPVAAQAPRPVADEQVELRLAA
jgi:hypothetical protein